MNLVDSSAWLEYFANGPNAAFFSRAIEETEKLLVPTICILEVFKRVLQQRGEGTALRVAAQMQQGKIVDLDRALALSSAKISLDNKLPLADSVILATARAYGAVLWTRDADFAKIKGVKYLAKR
ncbi:MAG: type II toxin-antitoxin system VapC family toxin [Acidobacteria bacterium]|nr:type II toxin-antitoxin system VapC family toxin [Acidobacteriota bacterium]